MPRSVVGLELVVGVASSRELGSVCEGPLRKLGEDALQAAADVGELIFHARRHDRMHGARDEAIAFQAAQCSDQHPLRDECDRTLISTEGFTGRREGRVFHNHRYSPDKTAHNSRQYPSKSPATAAGARSEGP